MTLRFPAVFVFAVLLGALGGCKQRSNLVYVPMEPQTVTLTASASTLSVQRGETVVLHSERRTTGKWKQIPLREVISGQCWVYTPPTELEPEVADNVHWQVEPENAVTLNRDYRTDHTQIAMMNIKGKVTLTPITPVKCEPDRVVEGPAIQIEVS